MGLAQGWLSEAQRCSAITTFNQRLPGSTLTPTSTLRDAMLHRTIFGLTIAALPLMMMPAADGLTLSAREEAFIHQILNGCKTEIRTAEAALKRPLTDPERDFAKQVIDYHLTLQRVLGLIAKNKQVATRDEVQADEQGRSVTA